MCVCVYYAHSDSIRIAALCAKILATSLHYRRRETSRQMAVISGCINLTLKWISVAVGGGRGMTGDSATNRNSNNRNSSTPWEELAQNIADVYREVEARKEALNRYALFLLSGCLLKGQAMQSQSNSTCIEFDNSTPSPPCD